MTKYIIPLLFLLSGCQSIGAQSNDFHDVSDGPYIFRKERKLTVKWIDRGFVRQKIVNSGTIEEIRQEFNLTCNLHDLNYTYTMKPEYRFSYRGVDSIAVISDVHGEFGKYLELLQSQGIIDNNRKWNFGKGHLVILGDCFDRGDQVTALLWHIFCLEKQAEKAGGRVHMLLGNHEVMVLGGDIRYTNEKYMKVAYLTGLSYQDLYSAESVLGRWLRYKPVIITLNNVVFVHGGISTEMIRRGLEIDEINHLFYQLQVLKKVESARDLMNLLFLTDDHGPLWYRGYFDDPGFSEAKADSVLKYFGKDHIIVGHSTFEDFRSLYGNKILGIDAGIGSHREGAILIIKNNSFFQGTHDGKRLKF